MTHGQSTDSISLKEETLSCHDEDLVSTPCADPEGGGWEKVPPPSGKSQVIWVSIQKKKY